MNRKSHITRAVVLCSVISFAAMSGCAKRQDGFEGSRRGMTADESTFAAGAGRTPSASTSFTFAKILISQGRDRDALYVLSHIIREHPKCVPAYNEMAGVYMRADRLDDAIVALKTGLEHSPNDAVLHNNLGMCHLLQEDAEKALESFTHAAEAMPTVPTFRSNRAAALALTNREAEAEREYSSVLGTLATRQNLSILARARNAGGAADEEQIDLDLDLGIDAVIEPAIDSEVESGSDQEIDTRIDVGESEEPAFSVEELSISDPSVSEL